MNNHVLNKIRTVGTMMRYYASTHGVPPRRQISEMLRLWVLNGIGPLEYYLLGLFRPTIPWSEKRNMISSRGYYKLINVINPPHLRAVSTNKVISYGMMRTFNVPTPTIHGLLGRNGQTTDGRSLRTTAELAALVARHQLGEVCFKPLSAWSGRGFVKVRFVDSGQSVFVLPNGPTVPLDDFARDYLIGEGDGTFLIQDALEQHPEVARFHPDSVNTLRVWMYQRRPGEWEMGVGNLRMGVGGSTVDNTSAGGIGAAIDSESGRLSPAIIRGLDPENGVLFQEFPVHPTTGVQIDGAVLPMWAQAQALCQHVCSVFPFFRLMGLDLAFGVDHPWIIEIEADPHAMIQVYVGKGIRPILEELAANARAAS